MATETIWLKNLAIHQPSLFEDEGDFVARPMSEKIIEFTEVHSPEQLASLGQIVKFLCNEPQVERRHAYAVLSQLSKHAHPAFEILADRLSSVEKNSKGLAFIERERKINEAARNALTLVDVDFVKRFANDLLSTTNLS